jgi:catechol 2,3-dioxygenase-like lactoylglutathione lyase family enzyme
MDQQLHIITLGVRNLEISRKFYGETLGWQASPKSGEGITFYTAGGIVLALFPREALAEDATIAASGKGFGGFTLAHNARSEQAVDEIIADLRSKGVIILKEPKKVFWGGYSSYFADPDGNPWEVAYNPFFEFDENGNLDIG